MAKRLAAASLCAALSLSAPAAAGRTTVTVLELGPGAPSVHRTTSPDAAVPASAVASLWGSLHPARDRPRRQRGGRRAPPAAPGTAPGMPLSSDPLVSPDAGLVVGLSGPSAGRAARAVLASAAGAGARDAGTVAVAGADAHRDLMAAAGAAESTGADGAERAAEAALGGGRGAMAAASLSVGDGVAASEAGAGLVRALEAIKKSGKSVVIHLVVEEGEEGESARRRLDEQDGGEEADQEEGDQQSSSSSTSGYKTMYEIQTYNLYLWTSVGLVVILSMVMGAFIDMRLYPDTLLHGAATKVAD